MLKSLVGVCIAVATILTGTFSVTVATAQSLWPDRNRQSSISFELMKPVYERGDQTPFTSVGYLDARVNVTESVYFVTEVPLSIYDAPGSRSTSATIGNPYAGLELGGLNSLGRVEVGARFPLTADSEYPAILNGTVSDLSRIGAFAPDLFMLQLIADVRTPSLGGAYLRLRAGPQISFAAGAAGGGELLGNYALIGGYEGETVRIGAGIAGLATLTTGDLDFSERTIHQLQLNADFGKGQLRPGVFANFWLDEDLREAVPFVFGFALSWGIS